MTEQPEIPILDIRTFSNASAAARQAFVASLGEAFERIGFVVIEHHSLPESLQSELYAAVTSFFQLPAEVKNRYHLPGMRGQRGYTGPGREHAKGRQAPDQKEFYHVGQTVRDGDPIAERYPANVFPKEVPAFEGSAIEAFYRLESIGAELLTAIALYLGLPENYFATGIHNGNSILRPIHYFPLPNPETLPVDAHGPAERAAAHEDINLITLLMAATGSGLEVLTREGRWLSLNAAPGQLIVNVGDMLQRLTNNRLRSTTHRVSNPPAELMAGSRYSIPFFLHPRFDMDLTCLECCVDAARPAAYKPITAGAFLDERLAEIGLTH